MNEWVKLLRGKTNVVCNKEGQDLIARRDKGDLLWVIDIRTGNKRRRRKLINRDLASLIKKGSYEHYTIS